MANVINKTTLQYLTSVHTPDYSSDTWIVDPILPDCESKYWKIVGDEVKKMTLSERNAVDAGILTTNKSIKKEQVKSEAYRRITSEALDGDEGVFINLPEWKQRNYTAKSSQIVKKKVFNGTITDDEQNTLDSIETLWNTVVDIRMKSDLIESDIDACTTIEQLENIDIKTSERWTV